MRRLSGRTLQITTAITVLGQSVSVSQALNHAAIQSRSRTLPVGPPAATVSATKSGGGSMTTSRRRRYLLGSVFVVPVVLAGCSSSAANPPRSTTSSSSPARTASPSTSSPAVTTYPAIQAAVQRLVGNVDDAMRAVRGSTDPTAAYANVAAVARSAASQLGSLTYPPDAQGDSSVLIADLGTMSSDAQQADEPTTDGPGIPTTGVQADLITVDTAEQRLVQDLG